MRIEQAIELARRFHDGQTDKAGRPYLDHIMRVVDRVQSDNEKLVAALHDLLEDTMLTSTDLRCAGCPPRIVIAVEALTKRQGENYDDFIVRAARDPIARAVKLADLTDNVDEGRLALLDPTEAARLRSKYASARELLQTLEPLDQAALDAVHSAETGVPIGAPELGIPQGEGQTWATFWCAESGCGRPAGTLTLVRSDEPNLVGYVGCSLVLTTFVGSMAPAVSDEEVEKIRAALEARDAAPFYNGNPELVPFWCPTCERTYCNAHWRQVTLMDEGFFDCIKGTCPRGHLRELWD